MISVSLKLKGKIEDSMLDFGNILFGFSSIAVVI